jgi:threonine dehydrogenase-like Zn-dependent dehydrogenase
MMKAMNWTGPEKMEIIQLPIPQPKADEVLIQIRHVGICGSDLEGYMGHNSLRKPPLLMGHEFSGTIAETGEQVTGLQMGDKVVVNPLIHCGACPRCIRGQFNLCDERKIIGIHRPGAYAEYVVAPAANTAIIPDGLSFRRAALAEPLACSLRAVRRAMKDTPFGNVAVIGAGAIGILSAFTAKVLGATKVFVLDNNPKRLEITNRLGFDGTFDSSKSEQITKLKQAAGRNGIDVVIDAAGFQPTRTLSNEIVNIGGTIMNVGLGIDDTVLPVNQWIRSETEIKGSFCYLPQDFADSIKLLSEGRISEEVWTLHRPLDEGPLSFQQLVKGEIAHGKIILEVV